MSTALETFSPLINTAAVEPLFQPWEEPNRHRVRAAAKGVPPEIKTYRRPSAIRLANPLRAAVKEWRELGYPGASDTTRELFAYWFDQPHRRTGTDGTEFDFRYYFCQREAVETFIFLMEVRGLRSLSELLAEYGGPTGETEALGIRPEDDEWARYAFKLATGAGKTKCMSLAIVWSYFHSLRESGSQMPRHFLIIAPGITVFERLRDDFRPEGGGPDIFTADPLIPSEWRGDWNFSVVLQDEAAGASVGGALYLTNIHRLYESRNNGRDEDTYSWAGPAVSKGKGLDTGVELRERITAHNRLMVLNDEAHHVWDTGSAWNQAIRAVHDGSRRRGGEGIVAQLDFSATPKTNTGALFLHIVCDTPLGEAVDAGIIKTPIIGRTKELVEQPHDDAAYKYEAHLRLGYDRWQRSHEEWIKSGKKPLLFVMCEDTDAADQITTRLNNDPIFGDLNAKTINLHTNLKGKIKSVRQDGQRVDVFVEDEKAISDDDLRALRRISRELDNDTSPYRCIVSVLMLREGWDVKNVTTIVPLRAFTSAAKVLPEQTLGRGLRRMTPPGQANELVTVIEHPAFISLYEAQLEQEGLAIDVMDTDKVPASTVTIFPDDTRDLRALDIEMPSLSAAHEIQPKLEGLTIADIEEKFRPLKALPLAGKGSDEITYEGRHLITDEVVEQMTINLPLLRNGLTAISFFVRELEAACRVQSTHAVLAPLLSTFLGEILFGEKVSLVDHRLTVRLSDQDVREHIRAVFVPLIRARTITTEKRRVQGAAASLRNWKPFQATFSEQRPVIKALSTLFNLVPCNRSLEVALAKFADTAPDIAAFAKNAGPQALRIDYLTTDQRLAFYTPDFFVRKRDGGLCLIETKGRQDRDVPRKAIAATEWCKTASRGKISWEYVFIPQNVMEGLRSNQFGELVRACAPALQNLLSENTKQPELPLFGDERAGESSAAFYGEKVVALLTARARRAADDALELFKYLQKKDAQTNLSPVFNTLLGPFDEAAKAALLKYLQPNLPKVRADQELWFTPDTSKVPHRERTHIDGMARSLRKALVYGQVHSAIGLLRNCLDFGVNGQAGVGGIFDTLKAIFGDPRLLPIVTRVTAVNDFRNTYIAHQERDLTDRASAESNLKLWVETLSVLRV